jgi:hypothetical protein
MTDYGIDGVRQKWPGKLFSNRRRYRRTESNSAEISLKVGHRSVVIELFRFPHLADSANRRFRMGVKIRETKLVPTRQGTAIPNTEKLMKSRTAASRSNRPQ